MSPAQQLLVQRFLQAIREDDAMLVQLALDAQKLAKPHSGQRQRT